MNEQEQLNLQAYLDGELTGREREEVARLLDAREDARALLAELQHTRATLQAGEQERALDCSREFYWSAIERGIRSAEPQTSKPTGLGIMAWLRRHPLPIAGAAAVACLAISGFMFLHHPAPSRLGESDWEVLHPGTGMVNYRDFQNGITVVMLYDRTTPDFTSGK